MQKIAILYDASQAVLSTFELDKVLEQILTIVRDYFHLEGASILLLDKERAELDVRLAFGKQPLKAEIPLGKGLIGLAAMNKLPIYSPDVSNDPRYLNVVPSTKSEVAIPIIVRDEVVGVLDCQSDEVNFFDTETIDLLTLFSTQASIALANAEIYSKERKRALQMEAISAIARQATAVLRADDLLVQLCIAIGNSLPQYSVAVLTCEEDGTLIHRAYGGSLSPSTDVSQALLPLDNMAEEALESRTPRVLRASTTRHPVFFSGAGSELLLPLVSAGKPLGVLVFAAESTNAFPEEDMATFESVADICATAIQNAFYFQQVEQLAYIDGLTGTFNRRLFERRIADEIERAKRYQSTLSLIMVDLDHFKRVNDEFGHLLGDEVLRAVSQIFHQTLRKPDVVCRYGGEEFVLVLPETSRANAVRVAEKLRNLIAAYEFPGIPSRVTISAGVADFPSCGATRDELVGAADDNLYLAKQSGRNCIVAPDSLRIPDIAHN
ncbi:MAG TPA: diguanylate cyclase [Candidatus Koribacter sp.]|jgi:diguanylate cyclase (GGDEF)-like protein